MSCCCRAGYRCCYHCSIFASSGRSRPERDSGGIDSDQSLRLVHPLVQPPIDRNTHTILALQAVQQQWLTRGSAAAGELPAGADLAEGARGSRPVCVNESRFRCLSDRRVQSIVGVLKTPPWPRHKQSTSITLAACPSPASSEAGRRSNTATRHDGTCGYCRNNATLWLAAFQRSLLNGGALLALGQRPGSATWVGEMTIGYDAILLLCRLGCGCYSGARSSGSDLCVWRDER